MKFLALNYEYRRYFDVIFTATGKLQLVYSVVYIYGKSISDAVFIQV